MGRKGKYSAELKQKIVEDCLNGRDNPNHVMTSQGIPHTTVDEWIAKYKAEGPTVFLTPEKNRRYSVELKKTGSRRIHIGEKQYIGTDE